MKKPPKSNNNISAPAPIEPLPTQTRLYLVVRDDTYTVVGGAESTELVNTGKATLSGPGYPEKEVDVTDYSTILAEDIPVGIVGSSVIAYSVNWAGTNYRPASPVKIGVKRNDSNPYKIDYTPLNTAEIVTDRWASLSGTITKSDGGGGGFPARKCVWWAGIVPGSDN